MQPSPSIATVLLAVGALTACQKSPLEAQAEEVALAIAARDEAAIYRHHGLSSADNPYCTSPQFARVLAQVRKTKSPQMCAKFGSATPDQIDALDDATRLLYQVARLTCENPGLTCQDYARHVLAANLQHDPLWSRSPGAPRLAKVIQNDTQAVVYVEFSGPPAVVRNLNFKKVGTTWVLVDGFPEAR